MRTGIKVEFSTELGPAKIKWGETVKNENTVVQNGLINLGTEEGSDPVFPFRGTDLFRKATTGMIVDASMRAHTTALAAERTRLFLRSREKFANQEEQYDLTRVGLEVKDIDFQQIIFNSFFVFGDGKIVGAELNNNL